MLYKNLKKILLIFIFVILVINLNFIFAAENTNPSSPDPSLNPIPTTGSTTTDPTTVLKPDTTATTTKAIEIPKDADGKLKPQTIKVEEKEGKSLQGGGKEFYSPPGSQVVINPNEKNIKVSVQEGTQIKTTPIKKKIQDKEEERDIEYQARGFVQLPDEVSTQMGFSGKKIEFKGILSHNGNNWYIPAGQELKLKIDGKESLVVKNIYGKLGNINENINLYFKQEKFEGNYLALGEKKLITGSTNNLDGNPIELLEGNPYATVKKDSHLAVQPLSNSEIKIENGKVTMRGGGIMNEDGQSFMLSSKKQELFWKKGSGIYGIDSSEIQGKTNSPIEFLPYKKDGTPVSPYAQKILFDDKTGSKIVPMTQAESRLTINQPGGRVPVTPVAPDNSNYGLPETPDYKQYAGPETSYRTKNFYVQSPNGNAKMYAAALEYNRYRNAMEWNGKPIADWSQPCTVNIQIANGNGGATNFIFGNTGMNGKPHSWTMNIQGDPNGLLMDVIPHETMHMVTAETFQAPTPRWIDEGIATMTETGPEQQKHKMMLNQFMQQGRVRPEAISNVLSNLEYPKDMLTVYAQGHSMSNFLIEKGGGGVEGKRTLYQAAGYANRYGWQAALNKYYSFGDVNQFKNSWLKSLAGKIIAILSKILREYPNVNSINVFIEFV